MKKAIILLALAAVAFVACEKNPIEKTAAVDMSGDWYVTCDGYFNDGSAPLVDPFGIGNFHILTANTAANVATEMLLADTEDGSFWDFRCKIAADPAKLTFSATDSENFSYYDTAPGDVTVTVTDGKILKGAAKTPSGMPADSISFHILFSDDLNAPTYYDDLHVHGYRYTGLAGDE